jgi:hypothetical protein
VADGEDAGMEAMKPSAGDPLSDRAVAQAEPAELRARYDAVLASGDRRNSLIKRRWGMARGWRRNRYA